MYTYNFPLVPVPIKEREYDFISASPFQRLFLSFFLSFSASTFYPSLSLSFSTCRILPPSLECGSFVGWIKCSHQRVYIIRRNSTTLQGPYVCLLDPNGQPINSACKILYSSLLFLMYLMQLEFATLCHIHLHFTAPTLYIIYLWAQLRKLFNRN